RSLRRNTCDFLPHGRVHIPESISHSKSFRAITQSPNRSAVCGLGYNGEVAADLGNFLGDSLTEQPVDLSKQEPSARLVGPRKQSLWSVLEAVCGNNV